MDSIKEILNDIVNPLAIAGLIAIGLTHADGNTVAAVVAALAGVIGIAGKK